MTTVEKMARAIHEVTGCDAEFTVRAARAALTALLEPSEGMVEAGFRAPERGMTLGQSSAATIRAAIQHALDEKDLGDE